MHADILVGASLRLPRERHVARIASRRSRLALRRSILRAPATAPMEPTAPVKINPTAHRMPPSIWLRAVPVPQPDRRVLQGDRIPAAAARRVGRPATRRATLPTARSADPRRIPSSRAAASPGNHQAHPTDRKAQPRAVRRRRRSTHVWGRAIPSMSATIVWRTARCVTIRTKDTVRCSR